MRLSVLCLSLSFLASNVLASVEAGPFESVFFYYAYRMDTLASGDANLIGKGCPGTGPKGVCYFDEFVKWIQKEDYSWDGSTDVGKDLDPDVNHAADQLYKSDCQNQYDSHKLLPQKFPPEKYVGYKTVLDQITTRVENILDGKVPPALQTQFEKLRGALGLVAEARTGDMTHYLVKDVNDLLRKEKTGWKCETFKMTLLEGYTIDMVDTEAMIKAHPEMTKELRSAIKKLVNQYATDKSKPGNYHYKIVLAIKDYQSRLFDCY